MMEVHVGENAATNRSLEKDFNAPSARSLRRAIEILGWVALSTLVITRLVAIFDRAGFFSTSSMEFIDPNATFFPSDGRCVQFSLSSWANLITGLIICILGHFQFMRSIRESRSASTVGADEPGYLPLDYRYLWHRRSTIVVSREKPRPLLIKNIKNA